MGGSSQPFLVVLDHLVEEDDRGCNMHGPLPLWSMRGLEAQPKRKFVIKKGQIRRGRRHRRARCPNRPINVIEKRVTTLRGLIPRKGPMGLDGLFRETADYIMLLETRVRLMQIMVKAFSGGADNE